MKVLPLVGIHLVAVSVNQFGDAVAFQVDDNMGCINPSAAAVNFVKQGAIAVVNIH